MQQYCHHVHPRPPILTARQPLVVPLPTRWVRARDTAAREECVCVEESFVAEASVNAFCSRSMYVEHLCVDCTQSNRSQR
jgi:hypothetical protein